jgi:response regulator RpfG family c-di-GMP phosphodiesterase
VTKVLYVEHNDDNLYMLKTRLELLGDFQVLTAEDSEKGRNLAVTEHPDVILIATCTTTSFFGSNSFCASRQTELPMPRR